MEVATSVWTTLLLLPTSGQLQSIPADSTLVNAVDTAGAVVLTTKAVGSGNNIALAKTATNVTVSGAAFTGGTDAAIGILICHKPYWNNVTTTEKLFARVVNPVPASVKANGALRIDVLTVT